MGGGKNPAVETQSVIAEDKLRVLGPTGGFRCRLPCDSAGGWGGVSSSFCSCVLFLLWRGGVGQNNWHRAAGVLMQCVHAWRMQASRRDDNIFPLHNFFFFFFLVFPLGLINFPRLRRPHHVVPCRPFVRRGSSRPRLAGVTLTLQVDPCSLTGHDPCPRPGRAPNYLSRLGRRCN